MTNSHFTNKYQKDVALFHETAGHPIEYVPTVIPLERSINRTIWTAEELVEYLHASCSNLEEFEQAYSSLLEGINKAFIKSASQEFPKTEKERIVAQSDALGDTNYFVNGTADEMGVDLEPIHDEIQKANMSKFYRKEDGTYYAKFREDGKILKAPTFAPPEEGIKAEIEEQLKGTEIHDSHSLSLDVSELVSRFAPELVELRNKHDRVLTKVSHINQNVIVELTLHNGSRKSVAISFKDLYKILPEVHVEPTWEIVAKYFTSGQFDAYKDVITFQSILIVHKNPKNID